MPIGCSRSCLRPGCRNWGLKAQRHRSRGEAVFGAAVFQCSCAVKVVQRVWPGPDGGGRYRDGVCHFSAQLGGFKPMTTVSQSSSFLRPVGGDAADHGAGAQTGQEPDVWRGGDCRGPMASCVRMPRPLMRWSDQGGPLRRLSFRRPPVPRFLRTALPAMHCAHSSRCIDAGARPAPRCPAQSRD